MQLLGKSIFSQKMDVVAFCSFIPIYGLYFLLQALGITLPENMPAEFFILGWTLVDGSHVYSTFYVSYIDKGVKEKLKLHLIFIPLLIYLTAFGLTYAGSQASFITILAYAAGIHFIRQEFGWMKIATRLDKAAPTWLNWIDKFTVYGMTIFPIVYFFRASNDGFWYQKGDIFLFPDTFSNIVIMFFWPTVIVFLVANLYHTFKTKVFNLTKFLVFINTFFGWYVAKVVVGNPYLAVWLVIFHHGLPYYLIIFKTERVSQNLPILKSLEKLKYPAMYLSCAGFFLIWYSFHWEWDFISSMKKAAPILSAAIYASAVTPQFTHFILDGFIWKRKVGLVHK